MSPTGSSVYPAIVDSSDEETDTADEGHTAILSPQYPPDHESRKRPLKYVSKSPVYPPPEDSFESV